MTSTENDFQKSLEIDMSEFEIVSSGRNTKSSTLYAALYKFIPSMEVGKLYKATEEIGYNAERTAKLNSNNILFHIKKNESLKGYTVISVTLKSKEGVEILALKCLKKPAELVAIPANLQKEEVPTEDTDEPFNG